MVKEPNHSLEKIVIILSEMGRAYRMEKEGEDTAIDQKQNSPTITNQTKNMNKEIQDGNHNSTNTL
ncbi:MAG: hypothetical protein WAV05_07045 [Anaerolineales bacterium]